MSPIFNQMLLPSVTHVSVMVVVKAGSNIYVASIHLELSLESTIHYSRLHQYSQTSTEWEENKVMIRVRNGLVQSRKDATITDSY
jgi:hypothetical protein